MGYFNDPDDFDCDAGFRNDPLPPYVRGDASIKSTPVRAWSPDDDGESLRVQCEPSVGYCVTGTPQSVAAFAAAWDQLVAVDDRIDYERFRAKTSPLGDTRIDSGWMYLGHMGFVYPIDVMRPLLDGVYAGVRLSHYDECPVYARILRERAGLVA